MSNNIKSDDLCDRCKWGFNGDGCTSGPFGCLECQMYVSVNLCRCDTIQSGTPCHYFQETDQEEASDK